VPRLLGGKEIRDNFLIYPPLPPLWDQNLNYLYLNLENLITFI
jgi:hypothetical protein